MKKRSFVLFVLVSSVLSLVACSTAVVLEPGPLATGRAVCERAPELCDACAKCPDPESCMERGGECLADGIHFRDEVDLRADVFTPGCHYEYTDAACTEGKRLFSVDRCTSGRDIFEWSDNTCHGPMGDNAIYDCDAECRRVGRGGGRCAAVPACGRTSAYCECDVPPPPDNPTAAGAAP